MKKLVTPVAVILAISLLNSCQKDMDFQQKWDEHDHHGYDDALYGHLKQTKTYSSEVVFKWIDMQLRLIRTNPTPLGGVPSQRYYCYAGIALYESVVPGMPGYRSLSGQLTSLPDMPETHHGYKYYWPACANAALAAMTRSFFTAATPDNKTSVDSLETALNEAYQLETSDETLQRSADFGKAVAQVVFDWSTTDGASNANAPYTPPVGPGLWAPTPPAMAPAAIPYWGNNRLMVSTSLDGVAPHAPPVYSEDPSSDYYKMVKDVYDVSQTLTSEQTAIAVYYRDNPGYGGGHYLSTFEQVLEQEDPKLDFSAYAFAKVSIAIIDAGIGCWKVKYQYNQERPIRYIREVLGHSTWNTVFPTPNFPDFTSAHSAIAGAFSEIMEGLFGYHYHFTDHTYDYLGMPSRSFASFNDMAQEIGDSRVYAGIHNRISCERGLQQGRKIGKNINNTLKFKMYHY